MVINILTISLLDTAKVRFFFDNNKGKIADKQTDIPSFRIVIKNVPLQKNNLKKKATSKTMKIIKKTLMTMLYAILLFFVVSELFRSFRQYSGATLDGDVAESVLPYPEIQKTFNDPTGIKTIINNEKHQAPNRFFSYYFLQQTFRELPFFFQKFHDPVVSVYLTIAVSKIAMHIVILSFSTYLVHRNKVYIFNTVEKQYLYVLANSEEDIVILDTDRAVFSWEPLDYPEESRYYAEVLYFWKITDRVKLYYNKPQSNED